MYYLRSRYYNAQSSRFTNADSLLSFGILNTNLQTYCVNNPIFLSDSNGRDFFEDCYDENPLLNDDFFDIGGGYQVNIPSYATWSSFHSTPLMDGMWSGGLTSANAADIWDSCHNTSGNTANKSGAQKLHRPYIRQAVRAVVESLARRATNGNFLDANTRLEITGKYHLGHIASYEFWRLRRFAEEHGMTQSEFNDFCNNPGFYQIEDPHSNMSHEYEDKGEYNGLPGFP